MNRIYVSPFKLKSGRWSSRRVLWAAFHSSFDMYLFLDKLRADNPTWLIESYETGHRRLHITLPASEGKERAAWHR